VDPLKQAQEVGQILQGQKPPPSSIERTNSMVDKGWVSRLLPNENDLFRKVFATSTPAEQAAIELQRQAKYPSTSTSAYYCCSKEAEPPVSKNVTQETPAPEPFVERRNREYVLPRVRQRQKCFLLELRLISLSTTIG